MDDFEKASSSVRRLMEVAGGSCDAYADQPPATKKQTFPTWEEVSSPLLHTEPPPVEKRSPPDWMEGTNFTPSDSEPTRDELDEFIRESLGSKSAPKEETKPTPQEEILCGGVVEIYRGENQFEPITNEYRFISSVEDAGELALLYQAFELARLNPKATTQVALDTGSYPLTPRGSTFELIDTKKNLRYVMADWAEMSHHEPIVEENDLFIWVLSMDSGQDEGYIHSGWVYGRK